MSYLSIKAGIYSFLKLAKITPYLYEKELPQNPKYPVTVYALASDMVMAHTHDRNIVGYRRARLQVDVYAESVEAVEDAMERYFELLAGYAGSLGLSEFTDVSIFDYGSNPDKIIEEESNLQQSVTVLANLHGRSRDFMVIY